jgi:hypothetical protein
VGWALGTAVVAVGWWGTSGEATTGRQFRWVGVGVVGLAVCLAAGAAWVFAGMRAVGLRIRASVPAAAAGVAEPVVELRVVPDRVTAGAGAGVGVAPDALVAAAGMRYFHRASCTLARGKAVRPAERAEHLREGRVACGVCRPDAPAEVTAA